MPLSFLEAINLTFNCFCAKERKSEKQQREDDNQAIYDTARKYEIGILPVHNNVNIKNLYPITDQVHLWNTFIVGNDKTYILSSINDLKGFPETTNLLNKKGDVVLPTFLQDFFDPIWDKTLKGKQLQFYMIYNTRTYFVNSYPFRNDEDFVIGAIMFIRAFEKMPNETSALIKQYLNDDKNGRLSFDVRKDIDTEVQNDYKRMSQEILQKHPPN